MSEAASAGISRLELGPRQDHAEQIDGLVEVHELDVRRLRAFLDARRGAAWSLLPLVLCN